MSLPPDVSAKDALWRGEIAELVSDGTITMTKAMSILGAACGEPERLYVPPGWRESERWKVLAAREMSRGQMYAEFLDWARKMEQSDATHTNTNTKDLLEAIGIDVDDPVVSRIIRVAETCRAVIASYPPFASLEVCLAGSVVTWLHAWRLMGRRPEWEPTDIDFFLQFHSPSKGPLPPPFQPMGTDSPGFKAIGLLAMLKLAESLKGRIHELTPLDPELAKPHNWLDEDTRIKVLTAAGPRPVVPRVVTTTLKDGMTVQFVLSGAIDVTRAFDLSCCAVKLFLGEHKVAFVPIPRGWVMDFFNRVARVQARPLLDVKAMCSRAEKYKKRFVETLVVDTTTSWQEGFVMADYIGTEFEDPERYLLSSIPNRAEAKALVLRCLDEDPPTPKRRRK